MSPLAEMAIGELQKCSVNTSGTFPLESMQLFSINLNKLTLVIGTVPSRILQQRQCQRTEYVHALRKHRPHDLRVIQHFVKVTPKTILASGLILQSRPLHFLTVEVIPNDALDGGGDDLEVAVATALVSTLLHDGGAGLVQGIF